MGEAAYVTPERTSVDGVPVFFLPAPGLLHAELIFRVGHIDEPLPQRGITHMVEHLALHSLTVRPDWWRSRGSVDHVRTRFSVRGEPDDISSYMSMVTANLSELRVDRLPAELGVLRTEAAHGGDGSIKEIWSHRFGARGLGVSDYREFGLQWLGASEVRAWAEERFTAGNAVLWISGAVPVSLRLNLRSGKRFPRPKVAPLEQATPAFYHRGRSGVALSMLWDAGITAKYVVSGLLEDRIRNRLRLAESLAYETRVDHDPGSLTVFADALAENAGRAAASLVEVIRDLANRGHRPEELERVLASNRAARAEPGASLESLTDAAALELGIAVGTISWDDYDREAAALTPVDVAGATDDALSTALLAIPEGVQCDIDGFTQLPVSNGLSFDGHRFGPAKGADHASEMSYSDEGLAVSEPDGTKHGIRWQDVAAALWWKDGTRHLIALDSSSAHFAPNKWEQPQALLEAIRVNVPEDRWVPMDDMFGPRNGFQEGVDLVADSQEDSQVSG